MENANSYNQMKRYLIIFVFSSILFVMFGFRDLRNIILFIFLFVLINSDSIKIKI